MRAPMTDPKVTRRRSDYIIGAVMVGSGLAIGLAAVGILPLDESSLNGPRWVFGSIGWVVGSGGLAIVTTPWRRVHLLSVALMVGGMAAIGMWIALWGPSEEIRGGLPFVSDRVNQGLGKTMFGIGSLINLGVLWWIIRDLLRGDGN